MQRQREAIFIIPSVADTYILKKNHSPAPFMFMLFYLLEGCKIKTLLKAHIEEYFFKGAL